MNYEEEQLAALHEASHAVVTLALGGRVESVTLDQSIRALEPAMEPWAVAVMSVAGAVGARTLVPIGGVPRVSTRPKTSPWRSARSAVIDWDPTRSPCSSAGRGTWSWTTRGPSTASPTP